MADRTCLWCNIPIGPLRSVWRARIVPAVQGWAGIHHTDHAKFCREKCRKAFPFPDQDGIVVMSLDQLELRGRTRKEAKRRYKSFTKLAALPTVALVVILVILMNPNEAPQPSADEGAEPVQATLGTGPAQAVLRTWTETDFRVSNSLAGLFDPPDIATWIQTAEGVQPRGLALVRTPEGVLIRSLRIRGRIGQSALGFVFGARSRTEYSAAKVRITSEGAVLDRWVRAKDEIRGRHTEPLGSDLAALSSGGTFEVSLDLEEAWVRVSIDGREVERWKDTEAAPEGRVGLFSGPGESATVRNLAVQVAPRSNQ